MMIPNTPPTHDDTPSSSTACSQTQSTVEMLNNINRSSAGSWADSDVESEVAMLRGRATGIEQMVCNDIAARQQIGISKYGTTVADNRLGRQEWLRHAYEEALDLAIYLRRLIELEGDTENA